MVALAQRVLHGIEQHQDTLALIVVQGVPQEGRAGQRAEKQASHDFPAQPGKKQHIESAGANQQCGSQIRLAQDQGHRNGKQYRGDQIILEGQRGLVPFEVPGHHQGYRNLHQFRRLDGGNTQVEPAPRAIVYFTEQGDTYQQYHADNKDGNRAAYQVMQGHVGNQPQRGKRDQYVDELAQHAVKIASAGAVDQHQADQHQRQQCRHQHRVQMGHETLLQAVNHVRLPLSV